MKFSADLGIEKLLNMFIANEFFAWQQYLMARVVAKGKSLDYAESVFSANGNEEIDDHFKELVEYAQSMGFDPEVNPKQMTENTSSPYRDLELSQPTKELVELLIKEERQAIDEYENAANGAATKDQPSFKFLLSELAKDERVHLKDLEDLLTSIDGGERNRQNTADDDEHDKDENGEKAKRPKDDGKDDKKSDGDEDHEDKENDRKQKKAERKIGKDFDFAKDFKEASKKAEKENNKKDDDEDDETVNESIVGTFLDCETLLTEVFG